MKKPSIINIVGRSNSGKTTLIVRLIEYYTKKGFRVSAVKSTHHDFDVDYPGKDSYLYREAGACSAALTNGKKFALVSDNDEDLSPLDIALKYFNVSDIIFIEGYREGASAKIEVVGDSEEAPLHLSGIGNIRFLVSDKMITADLPCFSRDDIEGIAGAIESVFLK